MDFNQNQDINREDCIKGDKNNTNLQGVKAIALRKMFSMI